MRKSIAALAVTAGLAGGALIGAPVLSGAAPGEPRPDMEKPTRPSAERESWAKKAMDDLVAKGTITQPQADAVLAALKDARPEHRHPGGVIRRHAVVVAAKVLGMTPEELRVELKAGKTIAQVASAKGVDVQKVIDALVAEAKTQLAKLVSEGKITQAQADERIATLPARVAAFVNGQRPASPTP